MDNHNGNCHNAVMKTIEVTKHFGTQTLAGAAMGIHQSNLSDWGEFPPDRRQLQIERLTLGALKAEPGCLDRVLGMHKIEKQVA